MRLTVLSIPILLSAASGIAFGQDNTGQFQFREYLQQYMKTHPPQRYQMRATQPPSPFDVTRLSATPGETLSAAPSPKTCSIPLLNATAPGKPVPMPKAAPAERNIDRMQVVDPAPACPTAMTLNAAPSALHILRRLTPQPTPAPAEPPKQ